MKYIREERLTDDLFTLTECTQYSKDIIQHSNIRIIELVDSEDLAIPCLIYMTNGSILIGKFNTYIDSLHEFHLLSITDLTGFAIDEPVALYSIPFTDDKINEEFDEDELEEYDFEVRDKADEFLDDKPGLKDSTSLDYYVREKDDDIYNLSFEEQVRLLFSRPSIFFDDIFYDGASIKSIENKKYVFDLSKRIVELNNILVAQPYNIPFNINSHITSILDYAFIEFSESDWGIGLIIYDTKGFIKDIRLKKKYEYGFISINKLFTENKSNKKIDQLFPLTILMIKSIEFNKKSFEMHYHQTFNVTVDDMSNIEKGEFLLPAEILDNIKQ